MLKIYQSKIGNVKIEYRIKEDIAYMDYIEYEPEYVKIFIITLKDSIAELKLGGTKRIIQKVCTTDWNDYLKEEKRWKLIENNIEFEYCIIECDIDNIFVCIIQGLGIYEDRTDYKTIIE